MEEDCKLVKLLRERELWLKYLEHARNALSEVGSITENPIFKIYESTQSQLRSLAEQIAVEEVLNGERVRLADEQKASTVKRAHDDWGFPRANA